MSDRSNEPKEHVRPTEDMMIARSPSERFWVTLGRSIHRPSNTRVDGTLPFTDDARVGAQSAQHVTLALFDKLDFLAEGSFVSAFAQPSDDSLTLMQHA